MHDLLNIMKELRQKCPWDKEQTALSLTPYAIEEAYEVEAAVRSGNIDDIREELGDLLLQVIFQSQIYSELGAFDYYEVEQTLREKLIRRHPHVFTEQFEQLDQHDNFSAIQKPLADQTIEDVKKIWLSVKEQENQNKSTSYLNDIKPGPALNQAQQIQKKVAKIGFDFDTVDGAYAKLKEELAEFEEALATQNKADIEDEFGDCLFSLVNVGRKLNLSSESALLGTIHKFRKRFNYIEQYAQAHNQSLEKMSLSEMDRLWEQAKTKA